MYLGSLIHSQSELEFGFRKGTPRSVQELVRKACRFSAEERYRDAGEMRRALAASRGHGASSPLGGSLALWGLAVCAGAAALLLIAGAAVWLFGTGSGDAGETLDELANCSSEPFVS